MSTMRTSASTPLASVRVVCRVQVDRGFSVFVRRRLLPRPVREQYQQVGARKRSPGGPDGDDRAGGALFVYGGWNDEADFSVPYQTILRQRPAQGVRLTLDERDAVAPSLHEVPAFLRAGDAVHG